MNRPNSIEIESGEMTCTPKTTHCAFTALGMSRYIPKLDRSIDYLSFLLTARMHFSHIGEKANGKAKCERPNHPSLPHS